MRDIREVLERWATWARQNHETVSWYSCSPTAKMLPKRYTSRPSCCDEDGLQVSAALARLGGAYPHAKKLLFDYYLDGKTLSWIAGKEDMCITKASKDLTRAEGLISGILIDVPLQMDKDISRLICGKFDGICGEPA